jgi:hypothetical protein
MTSATDIFPDELRNAEQAFANVSAIPASKTALRI